MRFLISSETDQESWPRREWQGTAKLVQKKRW